MHSPPDLAPAVAACRTLAIPYHTLAYRASALRFYGDFATAAPLYIPSPPCEGRYVQRNGPHALYLSVDPETPYYECNPDAVGVLRSPVLRREPVAFDGARPQPLVVMSVYIKAARLLNLFDDEVLRLLDIRDPSELLTGWKAVSSPTCTQQLGQAVFDDGHFEGILYPSAVIAGARNIVLFRDRVSAPTLVHFRGFETPHRLPDAQLPAAQQSSR